MLTKHQQSCRVGWAEGTHLGGPFPGLGCLRARLLQLRAERLPRPLLHRATRWGFLLNIGWWLDQWSQRSPALSLQSIEASQLATNTMTLAAPS